MFEDSLSLKELLKVPLFIKTRAWWTTHLQSYHWGGWGRRSAVRLRSDGLHMKQQSKTLFQEVRKSSQNNKTLKYFLSESYLFGNHILNYKVFCPITFYIPSYRPSWLLEVVLHWGLAVTGWHTWSGAVGFNLKGKSPLLLFFSMYSVNI